jgi:hypothetical protein
MLRGRVSPYLRDVIKSVRELGRRGKKWNQKDSVEEKKQRKRIAAKRRSERKEQ